MKALGARKAGILNAFPKLSGCKFVAAGTVSLPVCWGCGTLFWDNRYITRATLPAELDHLLNVDLRANGVLPAGESLRVYKSSQWVTLTRMHAQLVAQEERLWPFFQKWCHYKVLMHALLNLAMFETVA